MRLGHRSVSTGEGQIFFEELDRDLARVQVSNQILEIPHVPGQPVEAVDHQAITLAHECQSSRQLRTVRVFPLSLSINVRSIIDQAAPICFEFSDSGHYIV
jgi:hypothetical protein